MLPEIQLVKKVTGEAADILQKCFSPGVIEVKVNDDNEKEAYVADSRYDSGSRIIFRHEDLKDSVKMTRVRDHFICKYFLIGK